MRSGFVALVGRPNAGKSTLLNRLVGTKLAIVSDKPQTTRNRIVGVRNYEGAQAVFVDTPGIHKPLHRLNVRMLDTAIRSLRQADVVGVVSDVSSRPGRGEQFVMDLVGGLAAPSILILNKVDLVPKPTLLPVIDRYREGGRFKEIVPISALTGVNVDRLERVLLEYLPEGEPLYPDEYLTDQPERFFVAETVREKVLQFTRDELPFSTAVLVDLFEEAGGKGLMRLYCSILVEKDSQKPIVIGRSGQMIKRIGSAARQDLERFFQTRVFLDLRVKVRSLWREDERALDELGLGRPKS